MGRNIKKKKKKLTARSREQTPQSKRAGSQGPVGKASIFFFVSVKEEKPPWIF
jgi:hypothetical protein